MFDLMQCSHDCRDLGCSCSWVRQRRSYAYAVCTVYCTKHLQSHTIRHISTIYTLLVKLSLICGSRSIIRRDEPNEHVADHTRSRPLFTGDVTNITPCCSSPPSPGMHKLWLNAQILAATQLKIWQRSAGDDYSLCKCICSLLLASRFVTVSLNSGGTGWRTGECTVPK